MSPNAIPPMLNRVLVAVGLFTFTSWVLIGAAFLLWAPGRGLAAGAVSRMAEAASLAPATGTPFAPTTMAGLVMACDTSTLSDRDGDFTWRFLDRDGSRVNESGNGEGFDTEPSGAPASFWFRDHGDVFVVHDPQLVDEVRRATRPLRELGHEMGMVGGEMGAEGARLGEIGGRMGSVGARVALIQARLAAREATRDERAEVEANLAQLRAEMAALRSQMAGERSGHAQRQRELSRRMRELSARHREQLREVRERVREIAARARRQGKAERPHANA